MLLTAGIALIVCWLLLVFIFKITKAFIHVALLVAVVVIVMHYLKPR
jgi:hypothetical protein